MHDHLLTTEQTTAEGTLKVLDRPTASNQQGRACAIRAAGAGGADRVCAPCPPALTGGGKSKQRRRRCESGLVHGDMETGTG